MSALVPLWARKGSLGAKAHLHWEEPDTVRLLSSWDQALCGTRAQDTSEDWQTDPHAERCQRCLSALTAFVEQAHQPPDPLVTTTVRVTVTRKAIDEAREPLAEVLARDLARHRSWVFQITPVES